MHRPVKRKKINKIKKVLVVAITYACKTRNGSITYVRLNTARLEFIMILFGTRKKYLCRFGYDLVTVARRKTQ